MYDDETVARIERGAVQPGPQDGSAAPRRTRVARKSAGLAVVGAIALGLREVFDPPDRVEIEEVDPWEGGVATASGVRFDWHPDPPQSSAQIPASPVATHRS